MSPAPIPAKSAQRLRRRGYRLTRQRLLVLDALSRATRHLSAEELHNKVVRVESGVDLSTVYRTLEVLVAEGIVREADLGRDRKFFEMVGDAGDGGGGDEGDGEPHHHLVCTSCHRVEHMAARHLDDLRRHLDEEHSFDAQEVNLVSHGLCGKCRARA